MPRFNVLISTFKPDGVNVIPKVVMVDGETVEVRDEDRVELSGMEDAVEIDAIAERVRDVELARTKERWLTQDDNELVVGQSPKKG